MTKKHIKSSVYLATFNADTTTWLSASHVSKTVDAPQHTVLRRLNRFCKEGFLVRGTLADTKHFADVWTCKRGRHQAIFKLTPEGLAHVNSSHAVAEKSAKFKRGQTSSMSTVDEAAYQSVAGEGKGNVPNSVFDLARTT